MVMVNNSLILNFYLFFFSFGVVPFFYIWTWILAVTGFFPPLFSSRPLSFPFTPRAYPNCFRQIFHEAFLKQKAFRRNRNTQKLTVFIRFHIQISCLKDHLVMLIILNSYSLNCHRVGRLIIPSMS